MRHVKFTGPKGEDIEARLVYDYGQGLPCFHVRCSLTLLQWEPCDAIYLNLCMYVTKEDLNVHTPYKE